MFFISAITSFITKYSLHLFIVCSIFLKVYAKVQKQTDPESILQIRRSLVRTLELMQDSRTSESGLQKIYPKSKPFFCDAKMGPGKRSSTRPTSVHELRPGDIDIIMGMGDSLTAGSGISASTLPYLFVEKRGFSWSIGGQATWRKYLTLPNILREFNPNLYGYALKNALSVDRASRFNVAEGGAMSRDMPYQAQVLVNRLKHDPKVNMTNDWKVLTILIGANDFCSDICFYENPTITVIKNHERELVKTLRILRDNIPRLFINFVVPINVDAIRHYINKPFQCVLMHIIECSCFIGKSKNFVNFYKKLVEDWIKKDYEIAYRSEFNSKDFTVNIQPFTTILNPPKFKNGSVDYSYMAIDCFHFSQKLHKFAAISLWNNMLEPEGNKTKTFSINTALKCPTEEIPFLKTRENSKMNI